MTLRPRRSVVLVLVLLLGACSEQPLVPPDNSLTIEEYVHLGMPSPDHEWTAEERSSARQMLRSIVESDATQLPRFLSRRSGALFEKIVREEVFKREIFEGDLGKLTVREDEALSPEERAEIIFRDSLSGIYDSRSTGGLIFDRELIEILAQTIVSLNQMRSESEWDHSLAQMRVESDDRGQRLETRYDRTFRGIEATLLFSTLKLAGFATSEKVSPEARGDATLHLVEQVPGFASWFSPEALSELRRLLEECATLKLADPRLGVLSKSF